MSDLEDQREFLLRSLEDLEREHDAGDIDEQDYGVLKDDYTARAETVLRAIEQGAVRVAVPVRRRRSWVALGGVVLFALLAAVLVAQSSGRRDAGDTLTGGIRQSSTEKLNEAGRRGSEGDYAGGIAHYDDVLGADPDNREALTYRGWYLFLSGKRAEGLTQLLEVATAQADYPDVHAFLAVVFDRNGLSAQALQELRLLDGLDAPAYIRDIIAPLRDRLEAAASSTTTVAVTGGG
jgi:hypothetical protein